MYSNKSNTNLNRLKLILVEKTGKRLTEQLDKDQTTISKWYANSNQPNVVSLIKIAKLLEVNDLLVMD